MRATNRGNVKGVVKSGGMKCSVSERESRLQFFEAVAAWLWLCQQAMSASAKPTLVRFGGAALVENLTFGTFHHLPHTVPRQLPTTIFRTDTMLAQSLRVSVC